MWVKALFVTLLACDYVATSACDYVVTLLACDYVATRCARLTSRRVPTKRCTY